MIYNSTPRPAVGAIYITPSKPQAQLGDVKQTSYIARGVRVFLRASLSLRAQQEIVFYEYPELRLRLARGYEYFAPAEHMPFAHCISNQKIQKPL
jgi:hypothetical protein